MVATAKESLTTYLQESRDALLWKLDGLSEHEVRRPRTPTGTNLLGIVKHALNIEAGYLGETFGRPWPTPSDLIDWSVEKDPQADWYATEAETAAGLTDLYRRVQAWGDETIDSLPLEAIGHVPHWGGREVTLHQILVHLLSDLQRHAGHADILREQVDDAIGFLPTDSNMPDNGYDWPAYVARLEAIAERFR